MEYREMIERRRHLERQIDIGEMHAAAVNPEPGTLDHLVACKVELDEIQALIDHEESDE